MSVHPSHRLDLDLSAIVEALPDACIVLDLDGRVIMANAHARHLLGNDEGSPSSLHVAALAERLRPSSAVGAPHAGDAHPIARALRGEILRQIEAVARDCEGKPIWVALDANPIVGGAGEPVAVVLIARDLAEQRRREQIREEFLSLAAHELKTPLQAILGFAGVLQRLRLEDHGSEREQRAIGHIRQGAMQMVRLINELLDASRVETQHLALGRATVDLPHLVETAVAQLGAVLKGHPVEVCIRRPVRVSADPDRIEQVLAHLLANAAQHGGAGCRVRVEVDVRDADPEGSSGGSGFAVVTVADDGAGIDPVDLPDLFEGFDRGTAGRTRRSGALGLGLYLSRGIVEAHGGRIWVESQIGKGAAIRFTLPI
ncbi:MAG: PAS domain-containing protein [Chloroflexi bacterium]|nr:PAS domain-containing protein [Chloroflexota bacterium]